MNARPAPVRRQRQPPRQRRPSSGAREAALTEVVGTFLMLGIAVGFAAGFSLLLLALPGPQAEPHLTLGTFILPTATDTLVLEHRGGRDVALRQLTVALNIGGAQVTANVGARLDAGDPAWSVVDANGVPRTGAQRFQPGDQVRYTDAALRGVATTLTILDEGRGSLAMASAVVNQADTTRPQLSSARTTSTTTIQVNFTEALSSIAAADFTVAGHTISAAVLLGDGTSAELTVDAMTTSETPVVSVIATPTGTRDLANNLVLGGGSATPADGIAPGVSAVVTAAGNKTAFVNWTTSESATGWVDFGPDQLYGLGGATALGTTHSLSLSGLTPSTVYHFKIRAIDAAGNNLTTEPDRTFTTTDLNGTGGGGGGGGGGAGDGLGDPPPHYLEFSSVPAGNLEPGIASGTFTVTLRNTTGAAVLTESGKVVNLSTNSTRGWFLPAVGSVVITSVTLDALGQASFRYVDFREGGPSVLLAAARNVTAGSAVVSVNARGGVQAAAGDAPASLVVSVVYASTQARNTASRVIGVSILNPTPTAMTLDLVRFVAAPGSGATGATFFGGTPASGAGSDAEFLGNACGASNAWTSSGTNPNVLTCNPPQPIALPAFGMRQATVVFTTSNLNANANWILTAEVVTISPSVATVASAQSPVKHQQSGSANQFYLNGLVGGNDVAGFSFGAAGTQTIALRLSAPSGTFVANTEILIPPTWSAVQIPQQTDLANGNLAVGFRPARGDEPGVLLVGASLSSGNVRTFQFTASIPSGLHLLQVKSVGTEGSVENLSLLAVRVA